jgi:predicted enzyme related to lactoylglutathione lyase
MSETHGRIIWSELMTRDPEAAKAYFGKVAGWTYEAMTMAEGTYHVASTGGAMVAGIMNIADMPGMEGLPPHWFTYIGVDDVDAAVAATRASGGQVHREPWDVPGVGRIAIVGDPSGATVGIMTPSAP